MRTPPLRLIPAHADAALFDTWATWQLARGLSHRTVHERRGLVTRVRDRVGAQSATELTTAQVVGYLARPMAAGTRHTYYSALRVWSRWLVQDGHRQDDPTLPLGKPRVPRRLPRPLATEHLGTLLAARMYRRTRCMILLGAYQGLRVSEVAKIRGEDIDLVAGTLRVVGKGGVDVDLPLHPIIAEQARHYPRRGWWFPAYSPNVARPDGGGPILARTVSTVVGNTMRRAGVPGTAHSLRHWYGTQLLRAGADVRVCQVLMRHASLNTTAIYLAVDDTQRRGALLRLPVIEGVRVG